MLAASALVAVSLVAAAPAYPEDQPPPTDHIETDRQSRPVASGVTLDSFDRWSGDGWLRADALTVDLSSGARLEYLSPPTISDTAPISEQVAAESEAVAAVNGDFFDINDTGAPVGAALSDGELVKSGNTGRTNVVGFTAEGLGEILQLDFDGTATLPSGDVDLAALNATDLETGAIGEYTPLWGEASRSRVVDGATVTCEVVVADGTVVSVSATPGAGAIPEGSYTLVGREAGAETLCALAEGDPVSVEYSPVTSTGSTLHTAVGGAQLLIVDGEIQSHGDDGLAARSAVGFSADGATVYLLTVDGKQTHSTGITVNQMARMMAELGAHNAINIDGGGSSTMLAREPGSTELSMVNSPSDGTERPVANGLAVTVPPGSGDLDGYRVAPAMDPADAPGDAPLSGGDPDRVFPGLSRQLSAVGFDETYGPASGDPRWKALPHRVGEVDRDGLFTAKQPGTVTVTASKGKATGTERLTVLGELSRVDSDETRVGLASMDDTATFGVVGYDEAGFSAPIEPGDVTLEYDRDLLSITPTVTGFAVAARTESSASLVTVNVDGRSTIVPVTVGLDETPVANFDDAADWKFTTARATGDSSPIEGQDGTGLRLDYDFSQSTATRAAYVAPPQPIRVEGQPQSFGLWIDGEGNGEWPSLQFTDGTGASLVLRGDYVTWEGWQYVELPVPPGTVYPLTLTRFYVAETDPTAAYQAGISIDSLVAQTPPDMDVPAEPAIHDPLFTTDVSDAGWRFAVMSDAQFVARDPDSDIVASARRTLAEIKASDPDFVIINGDLVDEGAPADLAFARSVITEELGDSLPWHYIPGNHEVMGGNIDNFVSEFGDPYKSFDHKGTRFITLDTSSLKLHDGGLDQLRLLEERLADAAEDPSITSVVVVEHVPPRDPMPAAASQLTDRKDAQLLESWLADFRVDTGKGAAFVGSHVGVFHASRVDGVPYLINGNSGKSPAGAADDGGFVGWSEIGVDPLDRDDVAVRAREPYRAVDDWIAVQTHAQLDTLTVTAPATIAVGDTAEVTAELTQQDRVVPVAYPVSADWTESEGVYVGDARPSGKRHLAWFDPDTGELTALRRGDVTLTVIVNGVTTSTQVRIR